MLYLNKYKVTKKDLLDYKIDNLEFTKIYEHGAQEQLRALADRSLLPSKTAKRVTMVRVVHVPRTRKQPCIPNETRCCTRCESGDPKENVKSRWITVHLRTGQPSVKQDGKTKRASFEA
jgi:hypothetical protein